MQVVHSLQQWLQLDSFCSTQPILKHSFLLLSLSQAFFPLAFLIFSPLPKFLFLLLFHLVYGFCTKSLTQELFLKFGLPKLLLLCLDFYLRVLVRIVIKVEIDFKALALESQQFQYGHFSFLKQEAY